MLYKSVFFCYNPSKGADTMKKLSPAEKKAEKTFFGADMQKSWATHMKNYGPILKPAFPENYQAKVLLCGALTHITSKNQPQALLKLNSLQKHLETDADKAAFFFAMGLFCEYAGKFDEMAGLYTQANDLKHNFSLPYLKVGKYELDRRNYGKAGDCYRNAIRCLSAATDDKEKQLLATAHTNLASCLIMMHRTAEAEAALDASRKAAPMVPGRSAPEAILHALKGETAALLSSLNTLKTMAPFAYDSIKKSSDKILAGTEPQFFVLPVDPEKIAVFWNWFSKEESDLKQKLDKEDYDIVMKSISTKLLGTFHFLEEPPYVAIGKNENGYVIQLKDLYAVGIAHAYKALLDACPEAVKNNWLFDVVH